jgi:hypothetical protein
LHQQAPNPARAGFHQDGVAALNVSRLGKEHRGPPVGEQRHGNLHADGWDGPTQPDHAPGIDNCIFGVSACPVEAGHGPRAEQRPLDTLADLDNRTPTPFPRIAGRVGSMAGFAALPARICVSTNVMFATATSIFTCPGRAAGWAMSSTLSTEGGPNV